MKIVYFVLIFLGISVLGYSSDDFAPKSTCPPLFLYTDQVMVVEKEKNSDKLDLKINPIDPADFDRLDVRKKQHRDLTWIDSSPLVVWGSQFKQGFFVTRMGKGHVSFLSSQKKLVRYSHKW